MYDLIYAVALFVIALALSWPLGRLMVGIARPPQSLDQADWIDRATAKLLGRAALAEQTWKGYALALLGFNAAMFTVTYAILVLQGSLPLNPANKPGLETSLAFHTAMSFATNTNLQ